MRVHSREFRIQAVRRIVNGEKVPALSQELGVHRKLLYQWMRQVNEGGESNLRERGRPRKSDGMARAEGSAPRQIAELQRTVGQQQLLIEFFRQAFRLIEGKTQEKREWRDGIFEAIGIMMQRQRGLSVEIMCELAGVARSGYYRYLRMRNSEVRANSTSE